MGYTSSIRVSRVYRYLLLNCRYRFFDSKTKLMSCLVAVLLPRCAVLHSFLQPPRHSRHTHSHVDGGACACSRVHLREYKRSRVERIGLSLISRKQDIIVLARRRRRSDRAIRLNTDSLELLKVSIIITVSLSLCVYKSLSRLRPRSISDPHVENTR